MFTALLHSFVPQLIIVCHAKQITWHLRNQIKRKRANRSLEMYTSYDILLFNRFIKLWMVQNSHHECTFSIPFTAFFVAPHHHLLAENNKEKENWENQPSNEHIDSSPYFTLWLSNSGVNKVHFECRFVGILYTAIANLFNMN